MRWVLALLLGFMWVSTGCTEASPADDDTTGDDDTAGDDYTAAAKPPRVLVLGVDGVRADAVQAASTPYLDSLLPQAAYSFDARTHMGATTSSGPGWSSFFTGVNADKHNVWSNGEYADKSDDYPSYHLRAKDELGLGTALAYQWLDIGAGIVETEAVDSAWWSGDADITAWTAEAIDAGEHDLYTVVLDDTDHAGHEYGFSVDRPEYLAAIEIADEQLGQLLVAIEPRRATEDWLVVVSTDHGGDGDNGHGEQNDACQTIFLVVAGESVEPGELPPVETSHLDIHPTVLAFLGLAIDPGWDLDGVARGISTP